MKQSTWLAAILIGASSLCFLPTPALAASCVTEAELEATVGAELRAGAFAIRTDQLGDRPLCSGLTMAKAIQQLRQRYLDEAPHTTQRVQSDVRSNRSEGVDQDDGTTGWSFSIDPGNAENTASASATAVMKYGVKVTLFIDCSVSTIQMTLGYESNEYTLPEPRRSIVNGYSRGLMADPPVLHIITGGRETGTISWDIYEGGFARITPARMRLLLAADQLRVTGGTEPIPFPTKNFGEAIAGVMRQCRFRM